MVKNINELCNTETEETKNTGHSGPECLEGVLERVYVAKPSFRFDTVADFKDIAKWRTAIAAKDLVPLYDAYEVAAGNTEATKYETGNFSYETAAPVKKTTYESYLGFCSHAALASYQKSGYSQVFESNSDGSFIGVYDADGVKIKGQDLKNLNVGIRTIATKEKPANTKVELVYRDYKELEKRYAVVKPTWGAADIDGIYDVILTQISATSTRITVRVTLECTGGKVKTLTAGKFIVKDETGATETVTFIPYDEATDTYAFTSTGIVDGFTVALVGVVTVGDVMYELAEPLVINVT